MIEEARLIQYVFQYFLEHTFHTKRNMAEQLGVSYAKLIRVWTSGHVTNGSMEAMERLLHYCIQKQLPLDTIVREFEYKTRAL